VPASDFFSQHLLKDVPIEREIGHQALEACVLVLELLELAQLSHPDWHTHTYKAYALLGEETETVHANGRDALSSISTTASSSIGLPTKKRFLLH
jgi:hypothetical protein